MSEAQVKALRQETEHMFYHGFENYMEHAFPEDELRPISCKPLSRDWANPAHIELNDPLGNYSLTLIDSLSTLAILASSGGDGSGRNSKRSLTLFQDGVVSLVDQYGDGTDGKGGVGSRARGFDLDSKVQVFETVIRGVGGLLSAHLFAIGELPITGYDAQKDSPEAATGGQRIAWSKSFTYDGQLLRLARDLGRRLLPAFSTSTGLPYPRVNLRHGVPFYKNSPLSCQTEHNQCDAGELPQCLAVPPATRELTETCSAGAGTLVLEFTVLSRLTGDSRFEDVAKRAFWAVWNRRSNIGLVGSGIDAETGLWTSSYTGLGAGVDSFFEYAVKTYILLSGSETPKAALSEPGINSPSLHLVPPLTAEQHNADSFLEVWQDAHSAIKRHLYRGPMYVHPHYIQADMFTGAARAYWMDSLSAFFPGLLTLTGDMDEAVEIHLLFTALWNRYSALPERWSAATGSVESGLGWWGGRPEFIESTYHLHRATRDPWYLYVGEMSLRDIKRRCWTKCGWSGIQDVRTGERNDRMESFFLGETAKYLHLLFDPDHPLNKLDAAFVFTTEGHPLLIPKFTREKKDTEPTTQRNGYDASFDMPMCPVHPVSLPFSISATASRPDLFHAANLARLHLMPNIDTIDSPIIEFSSDHPSISLSDIRSPTNYTYFPWTLPRELIPHNGLCSAMKPRPTFDITFPALPNMVLNPGLLQRVTNGILINAIGGLRLGMIQDVPVTHGGSSDTDLYRIQAINNIPLGKDEKIFMAKDVVASVVNPSDPNFTRVRDTTMLDLVIDAVAPKSASELSKLQFNETPIAELTSAIGDLDEETASNMRIAFNYLSHQVSSIIYDHQQHATSDAKLLREFIPAITPTGIGTAPLPDVEEVSSLGATGQSQGNLLWDKIYVAGRNCKVEIPAEVPREHQVLVLERGGCSFNQKLQNIPSFVPSKTSLQLVVVVSFGDEDGNDPSGWLIRPLLDSPQITSGGLPRHNAIPMIMVGGGQQIYGTLKRAVGVGVKRRYSVHAQGIPISNLVII